MKVITLNHKKIGEKQPVFIVAELSANHRKRFDLAVKTIRAAKKSGADAIKLQTYTPDTITLNSSNKYFKIKQGTIWDGNTFYSLYKEAYMPWEWQPKLKKIANDLGLILFSSPFDKTAVDFLQKMNVSAYKIASYEITDIPLIEYTASKGKPVIISTGIATEKDVIEAIDACKKRGNNKIVLLKCTSAYPTPIEQVNLMAIPYMEKKFKTVVGLSDHTLEDLVPAVAVSLGARIVEKHFILDKKLGGPDAKFSLEPNAFKKMVESVRNIEKALGKPEFKITELIKKNREFSRSLFVVQNINSGEQFTEENVRSIRPFHGLPPKYYKLILGKKAKKNIGMGTPLSWNLIV